MAERKDTKRQDKKHDSYNRTDIESDIFTSFGEIVNNKDERVRETLQQFHVKEIVRKFVNQIPTLSEDEKKCLGRDEITNFGTTFRSAQVNIAPLESMVVGTDSLARVKIDTNDPEKDAQLSVEISNLINDGIFNSSEQFDQLWRTAVSEGYISGGGPFLFDDADSGLFPRYVRHLILPKNTGLNSEDITHAYAKREMAIHELYQLQRQFTGKKSDIDVDAIDSLIDGLKDQIENRGSGQGSNGVDNFLGKDSARDLKCDLEDITLNVWYYYEVRTDTDSDKRYVSQIIFVDGANYGGNAEFSDQLIIAQDDKAFDDPNEWLIMMVFDEEIGGDKTYDTLRGLAEAGYNASLTIEELFNLQIEGAMMTAKPVFKTTDAVDPDDALDFRLGEDTFLPTGLEDPITFPNSAQQLNPIIGQLINTNAGIQSADRANTGRGQELRQQSVERQANSSQIKTNRVTKAYKKLDRLLTLMVGRLLTLEPVVGTDDYETFRWFQECLEEKIIDVYQLKDETDEDIGDDSKSVKNQAKEIRKELSEKSWGRYKRFTVKANRLATGFDRPSEIENAEFLTKILDTGLVPSANVPGLVNMAVTYQTQNADIARATIASPEPINADQRQIALMEWDGVLRRATLGETVLTNPTDVHEVHIESHLVDLLAMIQQNGIEPWSQLQVVQFFAAADHINLHFEEYNKRDVNKGRSGQLFSQFQGIVGDATSIIQILQQEQEEAESQEELSAQDQIELALKQAQTEKIRLDMQLAAQKFGVSLQDQQSIEQQRQRRDAQGEQRNAILARQQAVNEILDARRLQLDAETKLGNNPQ